MTTAAQQCNRTWIMAQYEAAEILWSWAAEDGSAAWVYPHATRANRVVLLAFAGHAGKPAIHVSYRDVTGAIEAGIQFIRGRKLHADRLSTARQERRAFRTTLQPGAVLVNSWGYDQTNIDFFQVVRVLGPQTVALRPIAARSVEDGYMHGSCWPLADEFTGPEMVKRVGVGEAVKVHDWGSWARPWDGALKRWSSDH